MEYLTPGMAYTARLRKQSIEDIYGQVFQSNIAWDFSVLSGVVPGQQFPPTPYKFIRTELIEMDPGIESETPAVVTFIPPPAATDLVVEPEDPNMIQLTFTEALLERADTRTISSGTDTTIARNDAN